jgi:hypothetical protein
MPYSRVFGGLSNKSSSAAVFAVRALLKKVVPLFAWRHLCRSFLSFTREHE